MRYLRFQKFEEARKDSKTFLSLLEEQCQIGVGSAVRSLKASGICVDLYGSGRYKRLLEKSLGFLKARFGAHDQAIIDLEAELAVLNDLFRAFEQLRTASKLTQIPQHQHANAYVLAAETRLSALYDYLDGMTNPELRRKYSFPLPEASKFGTRIPRSERIPLSHWADDINESIGLILHYLRFNNMVVLDQETTVPREAVCAAAQHISLSRTWNVLKALLELWQYFDCHVSRDNDGTVRIFPTDQELNCSLLITFARYDAFRASMARTSPVSPSRIDPHTATLPPARFRHETEQLFCRLAAEFFSTRDLSEKCLGISLAEWLRAYWCLIEEARQACRLRRDKLPLRVSKWSVSKPREHWVSLFMKAGVSSRSAEVIVDKLTFTEESEDVQDCPLIPADGQLLILPSSVAGLEPSAALLSLVKGEAAFKGLGFEEGVRREISSGLSAVGSAATKCCELTHDDVRTYQCDGVFVLDDELFFIECKSVSRPSTFREYYEFFGKMEDAAKQLNSIASYYQEHLEMVQPALGLPSDWIPKKTHKVIVCNVPLGLPLVILDTFVVDWSALSMFVNRESPKLLLEGATINLGGSVFRDQMSATKLLAFLETNPHATLAARWFAPIVRKTSIGDLQLETLEWERRIWEAAPSGEEHIRTVSECYGIPLEDIVTAIRLKSTIQVSSVHRLGFSSTDDSL